MPFDPERFRKLYPRRPYPAVRFLSERARYAAGRRLAEYLGGGEGGGDPLWENFDDGVPVAGADASDAGFRLDEALGSGGLSAGGRLVRVEWYTGDGVEVPFEDLAACFPAFWQHGSDDLAVFDESYGWILYVTRDGGLRLLRAERGGVE